MTIASFIDNELKIVDTIVDESNKTITGSIIGNGEYFVLDIDKFLKSFGIDVLSNISTIDITKNTMIESDNKAAITKNVLNYENKDETTHLYDNYSNVIKDIIKIKNFCLLPTILSTPSFLFPYLFYLYV